MSRFISSPEDHAEGASAALDLDAAERLPAGGSTCDVFRARWQRRQVFIKRLKKEYRSMPLYLDALDKEFDIGVRLKHPSLPEYREYHGDYIVMDYIDGPTLAIMLRQNDPWLSKEKNVRRMFTELVDVVDYLHRLGVVHCDIKPDNIIITARGQHLVLLDLDKSYTDALNDTSGAPALYGLPDDQVGSQAIDFHAIGMLAQRMKKEVAGFKFAAYREFVSACGRDDVTCEDLKEILTPPDTTAKRSPWVVGAAVAVGALAVGLSLHILRVDPKPETSTPAHVVTAQESEVAKGQTKDTLAAPAPASQESLHDDAREKAAILDRRIQPAFAELQAGLDRLGKLKDDHSLTSRQLLDSIRRHGDLADEYISEAFEILKETYPGITEREAWRVMAYSTAYTAYTRRAKPELKEFGQEIQRRAAAEGERVAEDKGENED